MASARFTFYSTIQRPYEDMTCASMPKMFLKEISVQLMAQLTKAVVVEHMLLQNKAVSQTLGI